MMNVGPGISMNTANITQDRELLIRIDERMEAVQTQVKEIRDDMAVFKMTVVTKDYLEQRLKYNDALTYGFVTLILLAVVGAMIARVVKNK